MKRILVLYRELAGYFIQCVQHLCDGYGVNADIVAYPTNSDAPFKFETNERITIENRKLYNRDTLIEKIRSNRYDLIFTGGWTDKDYIGAVRANSATKSLLGFDTCWNGSTRQHLAACFASRFITPYFDVAFVPGAGQKKLALKMGFKENEIVTGAYCADTKSFSALHEKRKNRLPASEKTLMYVGRYAPEKFIDQLQKVFVALHHEHFPNWKLLCTGTGPLYENRIQEKCITHTGFLQPHQLVEMMEQADVFVLPSTFEPWGVVVHEFAAAGFPMVLSSNVGAREVFLIHGKNGFVFQSGNEEDLRHKLQLIMNSADEDLKKMGETSHELSKLITPDSWAKSIYKLL